MIRKLGTLFVSLTIIAGLFSPWATILLSPNYAFAQSVNLPKNSPIGNQSVRNGGTVSTSELAASGGIGVAACLGTVLKTFVTGIWWITSVFGIIPPTAGQTGATVGGSVINRGTSVPTSNAYLEWIAGEIQKNTAATAATVSSVLTKSDIWDCIAWAIAKAIWRAVAASVINWINSGFNGRPAFIQDLNRFMLGIADQIAGDIIQNSAFAFLCSPFSLSIKLALATAYARRSAPSCTLTQVMQNIRGFVQNFNQGGWPAWFQLIQENNNPYGAFLVGSATIDINIQTAQGQKMSVLNWSGGFLSKTEQVCNINAQGVGVCQEIIVTPGELIAQKAGQVIGEGNVQLLLADELNQIISALVSQLLQKALKSFQGLSGSSGYQDDYYRYSSYSSGLSSGGGAGSYTGSLDAESQAIIAQGEDGGGYTGTGSVSDQIQTSITRELAYQQANNDAIAQINGAKSAWATAGTCWGNKAGALSGTDATYAQSQAATASASAATLTPQIADYQAAITQSAANVAALRVLLNRASSTATSTDQGQSDLLSDYYNLIADPSFSTSANTAAIQTQLADLQASMDTEKNNAQTLNSACLAFTPGSTVQQSQGTGGSNPTNSQVYYQQQTTE